MATRKPTLTVSPEFEALVRARIKKNKLGHDIRVIDRENAWQRMNKFMEQVHAHQKRRRA